MNKFNYCVSKYACCFGLCCAPLVALKWVRRVAFVCWYDIERLTPGEGIHVAFPIVIDFAMSHSLVALVLEYLWQRLPFVTDSLPEICLSVPHTSRVGPTAGHKAVPAWRTMALLHIGAVECDSARRLCEHLKVRGDDAVLHGGERQI